MQVKGRPPATGCRPKKNWCYPENDEWVDVGVLGYPIRQTYIIYVYIYNTNIYVFTVNYAQNHRIKTSRRI